MKKSKNEIEDIKTYSENLVKNLINNTNEEISHTERQFEEDFYTKDIDLSNKKNTYNSSIKKENIEKHKKLFFNEDFDDEEYEDFEENTSKNTIFKIISIILIITLSFSTSFLSVSLFSTKSELNKLTLQVQEFMTKDNDIDQKLLEEDLKTEITRLEEENENLKQQINNSKESLSQSENNEIISSNTQNNSNLSNSTLSNNNEYIVQSGDNFWIISKKVYGDGSKFQQILDANNLTENSTLQIGQKLIIP